MAEGADRMTSWASASLNLPFWVIRWNSSPPVASSNERYHLSLLSNHSQNLTCA